MSDIIEQLASAPVDEAISEDSVDAVDAEGSDASPEDKALLLLDVVQAALMLALDGGFSPDSKSISFEFQDSGDVVVKGIDPDGMELEVVAKMDDLISALED